jgi:soluble lytic murein transglycosylase-like protein
MAPAMSTDRRLVPAPLFDRTADGRALVPTAFRTAGAARRGQGRPPGRRASALPWTAAGPLAGWIRLGTSCLALLTAAHPSDGRAQDQRPERDLLIAEAAQRFAIPRAWISAVMRVESAYDPRAVSRAGAMGLMQVMPATYGELRARHGLGEDPFHPRDNVMAGAAYLRELYDRFGAPGFLAAYNAGPERYAQHLAHGRPLPLETRRYLAVLAPVVTTPGAPGQASKTAPPPTVFVRLRDEAATPHGLFVVLSGGSPAP